MKSGIRNKKGVKLLPAKKKSSGFEILPCSRFFKLITNLDEKQRHNNFNYISNNSKLFVNGY